jgi:hypothetical protein
MSKFLTVKEAAEIAGKSTSSIRRIIYPILENDQHPDRHHIEPDVKTAKALRVKGENFAWKLSRELLRREVPEGGAKGTAASKSSSIASNDQSAAIIEMLRNELGIKNTQIATQTDLLKGLSERLREGNILIGSLQTQLSLTDGSARKRSDAVEAEPHSARPEKGSEPAPAPKSKWPFARYFGK